MEILPRNGVLLISIFTFSCSCTKQGEYLPTWESLDSRPLPAWYDQAKFGIFIHWGVFSVPSYASELFWYRWKSLHTKEYVEFMENNYPPGFTYADFAPMFTAEFYDPDEWADVLKASGARYVVLTSKHHEGFTMWPSPVSWNWNAMDVGPRRDLVGELARSIRNRTELHFGLYHSMMEWYNPLWLQDLNNSFKTRNFVQEKTMPELYDLVTTYRPEIVWSDGDINAPETYWNSTRFLAWLYNESPVKDRVVVNDRWGDGCLCKHGGFYTCTDNFNPGKLVKHKWENCMKIDTKSWGYRREATLDDYENIEDLIKNIVETISCGGNVLLNIGPTHDGRIIPIFEERLRQIGQWLDVNGQAIYNTKPWTHQNDTITANVWYTSLMSEAGGPIIYAITLNWPGNNTLTLGSPIPTPKTSVTLLGYPGNLTWKAHPGGGIVIIIPTIPHQAMPCMWAWVFKIEN